MIFINQSLPSPKLFESSVTTPRESLDLENKSLHSRIATVQYRLFLNSQYLNNPSYVYKKATDYWPNKTAATTAQMLHPSWHGTSLKFKQHTYDMYGRKAFNTETLKRFFKNYGVKGKE